MPEMRVVDTNVVIVASAAHDSSPFRPDATPVQESALQQQVLDWLIAFDCDSNRHIVLDYDWKLCEEYSHKLTQQDYGWLAVMGKIDRNEVAWVGLTFDQNGHAELPEELEKAVTDLADRKMVAAVLAARAYDHLCKLTNACDTDWLDCCSVLKDYDIVLEHIIEQWLMERWERKKLR